MDGLIRVDESPMSFHPNYAAAVSLIHQPRRDSAQMIVSRTRFICIGYSTLGPGFERDIAGDRWMIADCCPAAFRALADRENGAKHPIIGVQNARMGDGLGKDQQNGGYRFR
ncbi:MAG: hypothetical protein AAF666_14525 [Pseudomonadota bacterium]